MSIDKSKAAALRAGFESGGNAMAHERTKASEEQIAYAGILNIGMWLGLAILVITFFVYVSGALSCHVPIDDLPKYWGMKSKDFIHTCNAPTGWGWAAMLGKGRLSELFRYRDPGRSDYSVLCRDPADSDQEKRHAICRYRHPRNRRARPCRERVDEVGRELISPDTL